MTPRDRCNLTLKTIQTELATRGLHLTARDNRLVAEDDHFFAFLGFSPSKYSTADTTRRFVEIALRSKYLDEILYHPDRYHARYIASSCLVSSRVPRDNREWILTDEQSCIDAAREIARHAADLWPAVIDPYRTEPAMLALIARCPIDPSRQPNPRRPRPVDHLQLAATGYLLHKLNRRPQLDTFINLIHHHYANTPHLHPQGTLQTCLNHITAET